MAVPTTSPATHLSPAGNEYWLNDMYTFNAQRRDSSLFWSDQSRSQHLEGKMGMRESQAMKSYQPHVPPVQLPPQGA